MKSISLYFCLLESSRYLILGSSFLPGALMICHYDILLLFGSLLWFYIKKSKVEVKKLNTSTKRIEVWKSNLIIFLSLLIFNCFYSEIISCYYKHIYFKVFISTFHSVCEPNELHSVSIYWQLLYTVATKITKTKTHNCYCWKPVIDEYTYIMTTKTGTIW